MLQLTEEQLNRARQLVNQGFGRVVIERELGISNRQASKLVKRFKEEKNPFEPEVFVDQGNEFDLLDQIKSLMEIGYGEAIIALELNMKKDEVRVLMQKAKVELLSKRINKREVVEDMMASGKSNFKIARAIGTKPNTAAIWVKKINGEFSPADDSVKQVLARGATLNNLIERHGFKDKSEVLEVIDDLFPDCFVVETKLGEDIAFSVMRKSAPDVEWLNIDTSKKQFTYYVSPENNYMVVKFDDDLPGDSIRIYTLSDLHKGSKYHRADLLREHIKMIAEDPMAFAVLLGDETEMITKISVGEPSEQILDNTSQVTEIVKDLLPIAHKILLGVTSNHGSGRLMKAGQFDPAKIMCQMLKIPYTNVRMTADMHFRGQMKRASLTHQYGHAFTIPAIENEVKKISGFLTHLTHFWCSGHNHKSFIIPEESLELVPGVGLKVARWYIVNNGSYMKRSGSYAEQSNYSPTPQDLCYMEFDDKGNYRAGAIEINSI